LSSKGDVNVAHAVEIKKIMQQNEEKMNQLINQIKENDDKILNLEKQLKEKTDESAKQAKIINDNQNQGQIKIEELNQQIIQLTKQNEDLKQRIISATQAIKQATANLEILAKTAPSTETGQYSQLFSEIEQSISDIANIIEGKPVKPQKSSKSTIQTIPNNEIINVTSLEGTQLQFDFKTLLDQISYKTSQQGNVLKYKKALSEIRNAQKPSEIQGILNRNGIVIKNGKIMGGNKSKNNKKTKKQHRKQKGGFSYRENTKRRTVTSASIRSK
jgi:hypothetical protein